MHLTRSFRIILERPAMTWWSALLAVALALPALGVGWFIDDHLHQHMLHEEEVLPFMRRASHDLYSFLLDDDAWRRRLREEGVLPWYSHPEIKITFWRPVSSLLLCLDHKLAPGSAVWAHLHSLFWLALVVVVWGAIYRRLFPVPWLAGLATLAFAVDEAHGHVVAWVANRNALVAMTFAGLAFLLHLRWRQEGARAAGWCAPCLLLVGLLAGEVALAGVFYIAAHTLMIDSAEGELGTASGGWGISGKVRAVLPSVLVSLGWILAYKLQGYGTRGSGLYSDPFHDPVTFLGRAGANLLALLVGQFTPAASELYFLLEAPWSWLYSAAAVLLLAALLYVCRPLLRSSMLARFFLVGMVLSAIPLCATFPHDRLLLPLGVGAFGLVAQIISLWESPAGVDPSRRWRYSIRVAAWLMIVFHFIVAPISLPVRVLLARQLGQILDRAALSLERLGDLEGRTLVLLTGPDFFLTAWTPITRLRLGRSTAERLRILGTTIGQVQVRRVDPRTLELEAKQGFFRLPTDKVVRSVTREFQVGETHAVSGLSVEVKRIGPEGRPDLLSCRFDRSLEERSLLWAAWYPDGYRPVELPGVGGTMRIPATSGMDLLLFGL